MKYSLCDLGLLALAYGPSMTVAASLPINARSKQFSRSQDSVVLDIHRDEKRFQAAVDRQTRKGNHSSGAQKRQDDTSTLSYSGYWFATLNAGGQDTTVLLDTGSADLWLLAPGASTTDNGPTWDPTTATDTTAMQGSTFSIGYGQGGNGVNGPVYQTKACVGTACTTVAVGSATTESNIDFAQSGILGMAFQGGNSITPTKQPTFMEALAPSLPEPIFVTKFAADAGVSQLAFGSNPFSFTAPMQEITVDLTASAPYPYSWSYTNIQYAAGGQSLGTFDVVFDTGGPMSSAAEPIVRGYYAQVPGAQDVNGDASNWQVPCGTALPDLNLSFDNGAILTIPGSRFYNGNTATSGNCQVWFVKENSANRGVIGDPFFEQHVVVFNQNTGSIQWANQA